MAFSPEEIGQIIEQFLSTVGTRQYIGARYVPIFGRKDEDSIDWDNTAPYEPLTIVLYQGNSYTSRQYVPTGIEIDNTDFWAQTGNYNAQIQAYIAQVQQFDSRITANEDAIDAIEDAIGNIQESNVHLYSPSLDGSAVIITDGTTNILIDCCMSNAGTSLNNYIRSELGITHIDVCIVSHFHPDHAGGFASLVSLFDTNTSFFIQMPVTTSNSEYSTYQTWRNAMITAITNNSLSQPVVPAQGSRYRFGAFNLEFGNTIEANRTVYDSAIANNTYNNSVVSGINNYSLITYIEHGNLTILDAGDVEGEAQRLNVPYMRKCDVARNPHHFVNRMGYKEWYDRISPTYWYATLQQNQVASMGGGKTATYYSYLYRYIRYGHGSNFCVYNYDRSVHFHFNGSHCVEATGNHMDPNYTPDTYKGGIPIYACLPPSYYNANPFILYELHLAEWVQIMAEADNDTWVVYATGDLNNSYLLADMRAELLGSYSQTGADGMTWWGITKKGTVYTIDGWSATHRSNIIDIYARSYVGPDSDAGKRRYSKDPFPKMFTFEDGITTGDNISDGGYTSTEITQLLQGGVIGVVLHGAGTTIPCVRAISNLGGSAGTYKGVGISNDYTLLYDFVISSAGAITAAKKINIASGSVSDVLIGQIHALN